MKMQARGYEGNRLLRELEKQVKMSRNVLNRAYRRNQPPGLCAKEDLFLISKYRFSTIIVIIVNYVTPI
jgi:hypothetical protein